MANGDKADAAGLDVMTGFEDRRNGWDEINKTRDYIIDRTDAIPINRGGTGAKDAATARLNLGALNVADVVVSTSGVTVAGKVPRYDSSGRIVSGTPAANNHSANKLYVDSRTGGTSARRYKTNIRPWDGTVLDLEPVIYDRVDGSNTDEVGLIAEQVGDSIPEALHLIDGQVDNYHDRAIIAALIADVQRLNARITELETRP